MKLRTIAVLGGLGVAGIALIGAGAAAQWTTTTTSSQTITAGNLSVVLQAIDPNGYQASGYDTPNISLEGIGPVGSSFASTPETITILNNGTVTATEISLAIANSTGNTAGAALAGEVSMCLYSQSWVVYNGPLSGAEGSIGLVPNTLAPNATDNYTAVFYAGAGQVTGCGSYSGWQSGTGSAFVANSTSSAPDLLTNAMNGVDTPTVTVTYSG